MMPRRPTAVATLAMSFLLVTNCAQRAFVKHAPLSDDYQMGYMQGIKIAEQHGSGPLYGYGALGGSTACCLIGFGLGLFGAVYKANPPPEALLGRSPAYAAGCRAGFQSAARQKRRTAAYQGAAFGTIAFLAVNFLMGKGGMYTTTRTTIDRRAPPLN